MGSTPTIPIQYGGRGVKAALRIVTPQETGSIPAGHPRMSSMGLLRACVSIGRVPPSHGGDRGSSPRRSTKGS